MSADTSQLAQQKNSQHSIEKQVQALFAVKRYQDAVKILSQQLASQPDSYRLHYLLATAFVAMGKISEADQSTQTLIRLGPDRAGGYFLRSLVMNAKKNFNEELKMAQKAVNIEPEDVDYLRRLVRAQLQSGLIHWAKAACEKIVQLAPDSKEAHELMAEIFLEQGKNKLAEQYYRAALSIEPNNMTLLNNLSLAIVRQKKYTEAVDLLYQAMKVNPTDETVQKNLFQYINFLLDKRTLTFRRRRTFKKLPLPLQQFHKNYKKKLPIFSRYSNYVLRVFWFLVLLGFMVIAKL